MKNPGIIYDMPDGRTVVIYYEQPLIEKGKIVLYLVDDSFKTKKILKDTLTFNEEIKTYKLKGFVD